MNSYSQSDTWIHHVLIVLGIILVADIAGIIMLYFTTHSLSELLIALALVTGAGLAKLLISRLCWGL